MKVKIRTSVLILLFLSLTMSKTATAPDTRMMRSDIAEIVMENIRLKEWNEAYEKVILLIKEREGFVSTLYYCPGRILTIGYGHAVKPSETFILPITEESADSLLRIDFNEAIEFVRSTTNLEHYQLLAIAKFVYNVGSGNFYKSTLRQKILKGEPIDSEIIKWVKITTNTGIVKSDWLLKSRQKELELFNLQT